ncbi:hypothetical protein HS1genome_1724 [Sulfodiicoccus acidiphilus]|uniref:Uncharacterized protein n=1 Tax=Sulfodiicoccus acidiphilus TaxID=1670455 RepID=A0A348B583_9CREN|nr:hypothetical protein [Sulfodiicoccus acidiphilus]BBD73335.1 hypothetical protein HS1genome_1724 [Sulfodiicoccus acidiphilus]GGT89017.1 hypothetical protein GCM10007116_03550 [Sulfodiicoccus acidiphilus]
MGYYKVEGDFLPVVTTVNNFNELNSGNPGYLPLVYVLVIGANDNGEPGVVDVPVQGNEILLNEVDPGYWTVVVTGRQYVNQLLWTLDNGYRETGTVSGTSNLWYQPGIGKTLLETVDLQQYTYDLRLTTFRTSLQRIL